MRIVWSNMPQPWIDDITGNGTPLIVHEASDLNVLFGFR
jgi:hypothetical protein